jgi:ribonuclease P protein subunit RPR2
MKRRYRQKPASQKKIASERIEILFKEADKAFKKDQALANRYVTLARKISMRYKVPIPRVLKRKFCKHCYKYLMPGVNCRVRTKKGKVIQYCLNCKKYRRFVISK